MKLSIIIISEVTPESFLVHWWCYCRGVYGLYWENAAGAEQKPMWLSHLSRNGWQQVLGEGRRDKASVLVCWCVEGLGLGGVNSAWWPAQGIEFVCVL